MAGCGKVMCDTGETATTLLLAVRKVRRSLKDGKWPAAMPATPLKDAFDAARRDMTRHQGTMDAIRSADGTAEVTRGMLAAVDARWETLLDAWNECDWAKCDRAEWDARLGGLEEHVVALGMPCWTRYVSDTLRDKLASFDVGESMDMKAAYAEEIPDADIMAKVFARIPAREVGGIKLDQPSPRIVKGPEQDSNGWVLLFAPVLTAALALLVLWSLGTFGEFGKTLLGLVRQGLVFSDVAFAFGLGLVGAILNVVVNYFKMVRTAQNNEGNPPSARYWIRLVEARWASYSTSVLAVLVATLATLAVAKAGVKVADMALTFVAVGYAADSIADSVVAKIPNLIATKVPKEIAPAS